MDLRTKLRIEGLIAQIDNRDERIHDLFCEVQRLRGKLGTETDRRIHAESLLKELVPAGRSMDLGDQLDPLDERI